MKRIALAAAVALAGTGCIVVDDDDNTCSPASLTLQWDFQLFDGSPPVGCATAGVEWVDAYVNGVFYDSWSCASGAGTVPVASGGHDVIVEGIDFAGRIAYRDRVSASATCGNRFVPVRPAEGTANLNYGVAAGCTSSPCFLWFSVWDDVANTAAAAVYSGSPASVKDDYPYPDDVVIRLAVGSYTLDWMELMSASYVPEAATCVATTFDVASASETTVPATLTAACVP